jgi:hypothetical protein
VEKITNHIPVSTTSPASLSGAEMIIQRKLSIGATNDPLEYEADRMADRVMRMPETPFIQSKNNVAGLAGDIFTDQLHSTRGSGTPVPEKTRTFMENAFGTDFSHVRLHTDSNAVTMSHEVNAKAFTYGNNIYFNSSRFNPDTFEGKQLLTHELAHVVQQSSGGRPESYTPNMIYRSVDDWLQESSPDLRLWSYTQLVAEADEIKQWLDIQLTGSEKSDRLYATFYRLKDEIARRGKETNPRPQRHRKGSKNKVSETIPEDSHSEKPRILIEKTSVIYADAAEMNVEIDRIMAWLKRRDVSKAERKILQMELINLSPQFEQERAIRAEARLGANVAASLTPSVSDADNSSQLFEVVSKVDSIKPSVDHPGFNYFISGNQIFTLSDLQVAAIRKQILHLLGTAAIEISSVNDTTESDLQEWYDRNYNRHPVIGFIVSQWAEEAADLQSRVMDPLQDSINSLSQFYKLRANQSVNILPEAKKIITATEKAINANEILNEGIGKSLHVAGNIIIGLKVTKLLGQLAGAVLTAGAVAPAALGFSTGLGLSGAGTFVVTSVGTGTIVGLEGALQAGVPTALGEGLAGSSFSDSMKAGAKEGWEGFKLAAPIGTGAGAARAFGSLLNIGAEGLTTGQNVARGALAGGGGNFVSGLTGGLLNEKGLGTSVGLGLSGIPGGLIGGAFGVATQSINSPAWRQGILSLGSIGIGAGDAAIRGGSKEDILLGGAQGLVLSLQTGNSKEDLALQRWGAAQGRFVLRSSQAFALGAGIALNNITGKSGTSFIELPVASSYQTGKSTVQENVNITPDLPSESAQNAQSAEDRNINEAFSESANFQTGEIKQTGRVRVTGSGRQLISLDSIRLNPAQRQAAKVINGKRMEGAQQDAWDGATNQRELEELIEINRLWNEGTPASQQRARELARNAFDRHRGRYWTAVRSNPALRATFESAGMIFRGGNTTAPVYDLPDGTTVLMTLEHSTRLADNPARALSGDNLQFVLNDENSVNLEFIRANDIFQQ